MTEAVWMAVRRVTAMARVRLKAGSVTLEASIVILSSASGGSDSHSGGDEARMSVGVGVNGRMVVAVAVRVDAGGVMTVHGEESPRASESGTMCVNVLSLETVPFQNDIDGRDNYRTIAIVILPSSTTSTTS